MCTCQQWMDSVRCSGLLVLVALLCALCPAAAVVVRTGTWLSEAPTTMQVQGMYGQRVFWVVAKASAGAVYGGGGNGLYAARSNLAAAVVHCGVLVDGGVGLVMVHSRPNATNYVAVTRHGVVSFSLASDTSSFVVTLVEHVRTVRDCSESYVSLGTVNVVVYVDLTNVATVLPQCASLPSPSTCTHDGGDQHCFPTSGTSLFALAKFAVDSGLYPYATNTSNVVRLAYDTVAGRVVPLGLRMPEGSYADATRHAVFNVTTNLTFALSIRPPLVAAACSLAVGHRFAVAEGVFHFSTAPSCGSVVRVRFEMTTNTVLVDTSLATTVRLDWVSPIAGSTGVLLRFMSDLRAASSAAVVSLEAGVVLNATCASTYHSVIGSLPMSMGRVVEFSTHTTFPCAGTIWGSNPYTSDSTPGRSAQHCGAIAAAGGVGGVARFLRVPGVPRYYSIPLHGITPAAYGPWSAANFVSKVLIPRGVYQTIERFSPSVAAAMVVATNLSFVLIVAAPINATASRCFVSTGAFASLSESSFVFRCGPPTANAGVVRASYNMTSDAVALETTAGTVDLFSGILSDSTAVSSKCAVTEARDAHCSVAPSTCSLSASVATSVTVSRSPSHSMPHRDTSATESGGRTQTQSHSNPLSYTDTTASAPASRGSASWTEWRSHSMSGTTVELRATRSWSSSLSATTTRTTRSSSPTVDMSPSSSHSLHSVSDLNSRSPTISSWYTSSVSRSLSRDAWLCATPTMGGGVDAMAFDAVQMHDLPTAMRGHLDVTGVLLLGPPDPTGGNRSVVAVTEAVHAHYLAMRQGATATQFFKTQALPRAAAVVGRPAIAARFVVRASHRSLKPWAILPTPTTSSNASASDAVVRLLRYDDGYRSVPILGNVSVSLLGDGSLWAYTLIGFPPDGGTWAPQGIGIYRPTMFWVSVVLACSGNGTSSNATMSAVQTMVLEVPLDGAPYTLATEVVRGAESGVNWASAVSGPGSGVSVGRVTAVRSVMLCSAAPGDGGGGLLALSLQAACDNELSDDAKAATGRIRNGDADVAVRVRSQARGAIAGNGAVLLAFALGLGLLGLGYGAAAGSVVRGMRRVALPSSLFPIYLVTLPTTAGAATSLMAQHASSPCGVGDALTILAGWVMCLGPIVWLALLPRVLRDWTGLSPQINRAAGSAHRVGGLRGLVATLRFRRATWLPSPLCDGPPQAERLWVDGVGGTEDRSSAVSTLTGATVHDNATNSDGTSAMPIPAMLAHAPKKAAATTTPYREAHPTDRPESHAFLIVREYAVLPYAAIDAVVLVVAGALGAASGVVPDTFACRAIASSVVALYVLQCAACVALNAMNTLLGQAHSVAALGLATGSVSFQTAYVVAANGSTELDVLEGLEWMMTASAICDLLVMGMGIVRMAFDAVELAGAVKRMVRELLVMHNAQQQRCLHRGELQLATMDISDDSLVLDGTPEASEEGSDGGSAELEALFWDADGRAVTDALAVVEAPPSDAPCDVFSALMAGSDGDSIDDPALGRSRSMILNAPLKASDSEHQPTVLGREAEQEAEDGSNDNASKEDGGRDVEGTTQRFVW